MNTSSDGGRAPADAPVAWRWLRLEGLALLLTTLWLYARQDYAWTGFAWGFLLPDLALLAYLAGPRAGALAYNVTHSTLGPLLLLGLHAGWGSSLEVPLVWLAHIGADRALGYGLKSPRGFACTHLGHIGGTLTRDAASRQ